MRNIPLTEQSSVMVDDEDFEWLNLWKWSLRESNGFSYATRHVWVNGVRTTLYMHRLILGLSKDIEVDHVDGNGLNNTRSNLRFCSRSLNMANMKKPKTHAGKPTTSKYKGVSWCQRDKIWIVTIGKDGKYRCLGRFTNEIDAAKKYDLAAQQLFGSFARINFY
jgi:hypothetical protein